MGLNYLDPSIHAIASPLSFIDVTMPPDMEQPQPDATDYSARSQWLRATVMGANDGLVSVAAIMIGIGAINQSAQAMMISGLAGLIAGACSMAIAEFVSVYTQYDIELAQLKRNKGSGMDTKRSLPNPWRAASASGIAFFVGALMPLLAGGFIEDWKVRVAVVGVVSSIGLATFGAISAVLGGATVWKAAGRVLLGGWIAMLITYGALSLCGLAFKMNVSSDD